MLLHGLICASHGLALWNRTVCCIWNRAVYCVCNLAVCCMWNRAGCCIWTCTCVILLGTLYLMFTSLGTATNCNQANNTGHKHRLHHNAVIPLDLIPLGILVRLGLCIAGHFNFLCAVVESPRLIWCAHVDIFVVGHDF